MPKPEEIMRKPKCGRKESTAFLSPTLTPGLGVDQLNFSLPQGQPEPLGPTPRLRGKEPWSQRLTESQCPSDAALFPIPPLLWKRGDAGESRTAEQRLTKYANSYVIANECIDGVNELYGCNLDCPLSHVPSPVNPGQASVQKNILRAVRDCYPTEPVPKPREAARQLLGSRLDYSGGASSVEGYVKGNVSLPDGKICPVPLGSVLSSETLAILKPDIMLADADVVSYRQMNEPVNMYMDTVLKRNKAERLGFYRELINDSQTQG